MLKKTRARKKLGVEVDRKEKTEEIVSQIPFWWRADWTPRGKETTQATTTADRVSSTVGQSASISISMTGWLVR